jgi:hypothetical protein
MSEKQTVEMVLDNFSSSVDEDEETCELELTGEDGEKAKVTMDRELAEELALELFQLLGLDSVSKEGD